MRIVNGTDVVVVAERASLSPADRDGHEPVTSQLLPFPIGDAADGENNDASPAEEEAGYGHGV